MAKNNFLEEQRRRQKELVEARKAKLDPSAAAPVAEKEETVLTFEQKFQNFWYYNKWFVLIGIFLVIMLSITISQCATREKFDYQIVLYSYDTYMPAETEVLKRELAAFGEDLNGDGEVKVQIIDCSFGKDETADSKGAKRQKLTALLASNDDALIFIVEEESFKFLEDAYPGFFVDLELDSKEGRAQKLSQQFYNKVNTSEEYKELNEILEDDEKRFELPQGLMVARRVADKNTLIGQSKDIEEKIAAADKFIEKIAG